MDLARILRYEDPKTADAVGVPALGLGLTAACRGLTPFWSKYKTFDVWSRVCGPAQEN